MARETEERSIGKEKKKRREKERHKGPYIGAEGNKALVVALVVPERRHTKQREDGPDYHTVLMLGL